MAVRIVTDSTSDLPLTMATEYGIEVVPLNVHFGDSTFKDGVDITTDQFFDKLINGDEFPSTSQPSMGEFVEAYERIYEEGDEVVSVHLSSKLSGTYNSAEQASKHLEGKIKIHLVDTEQVTFTVGFAAIAAAKVASNGGSAEDAVKAARSISARSNFYALFDTLEFLAKGGRIGRAQSMLGSLLKIRPLLMLANGVVEPYSKARSRSAGMAELEKAVRALGRAEDIAIMYSTEDDEAHVIADKLIDILPEGKRPLISRVGPVIGTHAGPRLIAVGHVSNIPGES